MTSPDELRAALDRLDSIDAVHKDCEEQQRHSLVGVMRRLLGLSPYDHVTVDLRRKIDAMRERIGAELASCDSHKWIDPR